MSVANRGKKKWNSKIYQSPSELKVESAEADLSQASFDKLDIPGFQNIIVLVLVMILVGVGVYAVSGFVQDAKERQALTQCRYCLVAAKKVVLEDYAMEQDIADEKKADVYEQIQQLSGEDGTVVSLKVKKSEITRLVYKASNGLKVVYQDGEYTVMPGS